MKELKQDYQIYLSNEPIAKELPNLSKEWETLSTQVKQTKKQISKMKENLERLSEKFEEEKLIELRNKKNKIDREEAGLLKQKEHQEKQLEEYNELLKRLNKLEEQKHPYTPDERVFWYLVFQPHNVKIPSEILGLTCYLPYGLEDNKIYEKWDELLELLRKKDFFNKLSKKKIEDGEEIIHVL